MGVGAIAFSGIASALFFLVGAFNETVAKLMITTFAMGWYGMMASLIMRGNKDPLDILQSVAGAVVCGLGFLVALHQIWAVWGGHGDEFSKEVELMLTFASLSFALVWFAQLRKAVGSQAIQLLSWGTIVLVAAVEIMVLILIWHHEHEMNEMFIRFLATFTVLAVTGSFILPILRKLSKSTAE